MDAWTSTTAYRAVGIYFGGAHRLCSSQPNLTPTWLSTQASRNWHFIPIYVGTQASSLGSTAASMGTAEADDAVSAAAALGIPAGSVLYSDMEAYSSTYSSNVLAYMNAWTAELHARGYKAGAYGSLSSLVHDLNAHYGPSSPDVMWFASWNGVKNTDTSFISAGNWADHQRIHQYSGDVTETHGGFTLQIDGDFLDVQVAGTGSTPPPAPDWPHGTPATRTRNRRGRAAAGRRRPPSTARERYRRAPQSLAAWCDETVTDTLLVLVRHADSVWPTPGGPDDLHRPLTPLGLRQAEELAAELAGLRPAAVLSSPYPRAVQTVRPAARRLGLPVLTRPELREWDSGLAPTPDYARHHAHSWANPGLARPGGESLAALTARAVAALTAVAAEHPGRTVLVGSHGTFVARALAGFGVPVDVAFHASMPMPAVHRLRITPAGAVHATGPGLPS